MKETLKEMNEVSKETLWDDFLFGVEDTATIENLRKLYQNIAEKLIEMGDAETVDDAMSNVYRRTKDFEDLLNTTSFPIARRVLIHLKEDKHEKITPNVIFDYILKMQETLNDKLRSVVGDIDFEAEVCAHVSEKIINDVNACLI
jgi:hypothetical protein